VIDLIRAAWSWIGLDAVRIETTSAFGNVIVEDGEGRFWRICPEEPSCTIIATDRATYTALWTNPEFVRDMEMAHLVEEAARLLGPLAVGRCYCLKVPGVFGGAYKADNLATINLAELISSSGDLAYQIKDVPDGAKVELKIVD